jgi:hypothetical protein
MAVTVKMSAQGLEVFNEQTAPKFEVRDGAKLIGEITVSKGGVRWLPAGFSEPHFYLSWSDFNELMQKQKRQ